LGTVIIDGKSFRFSKDRNILLHDLVHNTKTPRLMTALKDKEELLVLSPTTKKTERFFPVTKGKTTGKMEDIARRFLPMKFWEVLMEAYDGEAHYTYHAYRSGNDDLKSGKYQVPLQLLFVEAQE